MDRHSFDMPRLERDPENFVRGEGVYAVHETANPPTPFDIHMHPEVEIGLIFDGVEEIHFSEYIHTCRRGDVWLCAPWEPHAWQIQAPNTTNLVVIFAPDFLGEELVGPIPWLTIFSLPPHLRPRVHDNKAREAVLSAAETICREIAATEPFWERTVRLEVLRILNELVRRDDGTGPIAERPNAKLASMSQLMPAFALVHSLPWRRVSAKEAAAACGLSVSRFHYLFGKVAGMGFGQFGIRARLAFAANLLVKSDHTLSDIAAESGFVDHSHLHRVFVKQYGCTPSEFRRRRRSEWSDVSTDRDECREPAIR